MSNIKTERSIEKITIDLNFCARCSANHKQVEFRTFIRSPIEDQDGTVWAYWALCPANGEPILLRRDEAEEE